MERDEKEKKEMEKDPEKRLASFLTSETDIFQKTQNREGRKLRKRSKKERTQIKMALEKDLLPSSTNFFSFFN